MVVLIVADVVGSAAGVVYGPKLLSLQRDIGPLAVDNDGTIRNSRQYFLSKTNHALAATDSTQH